jgi:hypothetical protein
VSASTASPLPAGYPSAGTGLAVLLWFLLDPGGAPIAAAALTAAAFTAAGHLAAVLIGRTGGTSAVHRASAAVHRRTRHQV